MESEASQNGFPCKRCGFKRGAEHLACASCTADVYRTLFLSEETNWKPLDEQAEKDLANK